MPTAHIYPFSRLVHASPGGWVQSLALIEEGKTFAFRYYLPMREAVVQLCASHGKGRDAIFSAMVAKAQATGGARARRIAKDNSAAFEVFEADFLPRVVKYRQHFLRQKQAGVEFEGLTLEGAPHFEVLDDDRKKRHVFLHAANWSRGDLLAYLELLGIIIEKNFGGNSSSLWVMDLRSGKDFKWRSSSRMRKRCKAAAKLYARLVGGVQAP